MSRTAGRLGSRRPDIGGPGRPTDVEGEALRGFYLVLLVVLVVALVGLRFWLPGRARDAGRNLRRRADGEG
ncbi:hypothetical protein [Micromonospora sp. WMMD980]|uniref:hypothetical protein n=1 Tax=Micromonospora sp. WMMD980 TaxID=3016088 RepID=UPI002417A750|nr:hypothetical protein [Micromonospora sp. WMMD980]MDG4800544.1 hypothetical protein [Micromonospora sp. WMMD980]